MERRRAIELLSSLEGHDLVELANDRGITIWRDGKKNKGWAGHVIERFLGLPLNSAQSPNFGSWELKIVPLKFDRSGNLKVKETMAITMIDPVNVAATPFEESHLLAKLTKVVVCARIFLSQQEASSALYKVASFDLGNEELFTQVKSDYNLIRNSIINEGFSSLTGKMGVLVQPRTKGPGHGSISRAFYARTKFVATILGMQS